MTREELRAAYQNDYATIVASLFWLRLPTSVQNRIKAWDLFVAQATNAELDKLIALNAIFTEKDMANLTQEEAAKALGLDPTQWDWAKIIAILKIILGLFAQQKNQAKAAGCSEHEALMHDAIEHCLQAACDCSQCCCPPTP